MIISWMGAEALIQKIVEKNRQSKKAGEAVK